MTDSPATAPVALGYWELRTLRAAALGHAHRRRRQSKSRPFVPMTGRLDVNKAEAEQAEAAAQAITEAIERTWPGRDAEDTADRNRKKAAAGARRDAEDGVAP